MFALKRLRYSSITVTLFPKEQSFIDVYYQNLYLLLGIIIRSVDIFCISYLSKPANLIIPNVPFVICVKVNSLI